MFSITQSYESNLSPQQIEAWLKAKNEEAGGFFGGKGYDMSYSNNSFSMRKNRKSRYSPYYPVVNGDYKVASNGKTQVNIQIEPHLAVMLLAALPLFVGLIMMSMLSSSELSPLLGLALIALTPVFIYSAITPVKKAQPWIEKELQLSKLNNPA